jgi:acyl-CoA thioesterase
VTTPPMTVDADATRSAFEHALATHRQVPGQFFMARLLGLEIEYSEDTCTISFDVKDFMLNPQATLHGGIVALVMDVSMGHMLNRIDGACTTLEMKTQYLAAIRPGPAKVVGQVLRRGRSVSFLESRFYDSTGQLAAFATSTWKLLGPSAARPAGA